MRFWKGMLVNVLAIRATGFVGSAVARQLLAEGPVVRELSRADCASD